MSGGNSHDKSSAANVAALFVETDGIYFGLSGVDPWDEPRNALLYAGPWPVVAHPPCARWSSLAFVNQAMYGYKVGDDGGCFEHALACVRAYGGVLEHPAGSIAWKHHGLPQPVRDGWAQALDDEGWTTEVSQVSYGHRARKRTWLYYRGVAPPAALDWRDAEGECRTIATTEPQAVAVPEIADDGVAKASRWYMRWLRSVTPCSRWHAVRSGSRSQRERRRTAECRYGFSVWTTERGGVDSASEQRAAPALVTGVGPD